MNFKKSIIIISTIVIISLLTFVTTQKAMIPDLVASNWEGSGVQCEVADDGTILLTLSNDTNLDIIIQDGEKAMLNLNGHTLSNYTDACEAIKVMEGGELTIIDPEGTGKVTHKNTSTFGAMTNRGTLTIKGGNFEGVQYEGEDPNVDDTDVLYNLGTCIIEGGNFSSPSEETNVIDCITEGTLAGNLTIKGGNFASPFCNIVAWNGATVVIEGGAYNGTAVAISGRPYVTITDDSYRYMEPSDFLRWDNDNYYWERTDESLTLQETIDIATLANDAVFIQPDPNVELYSNGKEIKPDIWVQINGLNYDGKYTVTYDGIAGNLIDPGIVNYTVTFTEGKYRGEISSSYAIENPRVYLEDGEENQVLVIGAGRFDLKTILTMGNGQSLLDVRPTVSLAVDGIVDVDSSYVVTPLQAGFVNVDIGNVSVYFKVIDASSDIQADFPVIDMSQTINETTIGLVDEDMVDAKTVLTTSLDTLREKNEDVNTAVVNALKDNKAVSVDLYVKALQDENVNTNVLTAIHDLLVRNNLSTATIANYFDIGVNINANNEKIGYIDQLNRDVNITAALPEKLQKKDTSDNKTRHFYFAATHQTGPDTYDAELVPATLSNDGDALSAGVSRFSVYALTYIDVENEHEGELPPVDPSNSEGNNNNGDNNKVDPNSETPTSEDPGSEDPTSETPSSETPATTSDDIVQEVEGDVTDEVKEKLNVESPKTGDNIVTIVITLILAATAFTAIVIFKHKSNNKTK